MAYYHIDRTQRLIQSLGFLGESSNRDEPIAVHPHFYNQCNAFYSPFNAGLHFGDGGMGCPPDAAEDASIVVHEYGHALQDDAAPGWGLSAIPLQVEQARAIGEGFSDYLAGAVLGDTCIGGWGLVSGACLRTLDNDQVFPADFEACPDKPDGTEEEHCAGLIWGGALWDLAEALGGDDDARQLVLRLAVEANFYLAPTATFADNAAAVVQADVELYGGAHGATIESVFTARGITPAVTINDFAYYFLRLRHTFIGDLEVRLKVGTNIASPLCTELIWNHGGGSADDLLGYVSIAGSGCSAFFPPSESVPWHLEVKDTATGDIGTVAEFQLTMPDDSSRCVAPGVPLAIPDSSSAGVVATVDCTNQEVGQIFDMDGDGCSNIDELGSNPSLGGDRDPLDFWDFFEVSGDGLIDFNDALLILSLFGQGPGDLLYDPLFDRTAPDLAKPYRTAPAGDGIDFNDVLLNLSSFGHGCAP
jgi:subtilisin-like proprotein convertase family protein